MPLHHAVLALQIGGELDSDVVVTVVITLCERYLRACACTVATRGAWLLHWTRSTALRAHRQDRQGSNGRPLAAIRIVTAADILDAELELAAMVCSDIYFHINDGPLAVARDHTCVAKTEARATSHSTTAAAVRASSGVWTVSAAKRHDITKARHIT